MPKKSKGIPQEFDDVAYQGDISAVQARMDKCYSSERYEDFQITVEKILSRWLKGNVVWIIVLWIITLVGSMFLEKLGKIF